MSLPATDFPELPPLAHNGWELATWVVLAIATVAVAYAFSIHRTARRDLKAIRYQTENDHDPRESNLREDVDSVGDRLDDALDKLADLVRDIRGLRGEVGDMRKEVGGIRGDMREQHRRQTALDHRVTELEQGST
ncbi:hypothetical protein E3G52_000386 [Mycobacteroides abscessus]|uniref:hypothetical protein n=1 Tax=Mycobacteroides abscessus TaxID=36809 RepID=UPI001877DD0A|nr:hypothetical protein [Mycobacteroides abscessus]MBE5453522.1 hypothetical protein [Mycobacteroides abscessus]